MFSQTREYTVGWAFIAYYSFASVIWVYLKIVNALQSLNKPGSLKQQNNMRLTLTPQSNHVFVKTRKFLKQSGNENDPDLMLLNHHTDCQYKYTSIAKRYIVCLTYKYNVFFFTLWPLISLNKYIPLSSYPSKGYKIRNNSLNSD